MDLNQKKLPLLAIASVLLIQSVGSQSYAAEVNKAQSLSKQNPWRGSLGSNPWQFDIGIGLKTEGQLNSEGGESGTEVAGEGGESDPGVYGVASALYKDDNGYRYYFDLTDESAKAGAWWDYQQDWSVGASLSYSEGAELSNEAGLSSIQDKVFNEKPLTAEVMLARRLNDFTFTIGLSTDLKNNSGLAGSAAVRWDKMFFDDRLRIGTSTGLEFGNAKNLQSEYGVTNYQYARTGIAQYNPDAGMKHATFAVEAEYYFSEKLSVFSDVSLNHQFDRVARSPLLGGFGNASSRVSNSSLYQVGLGVRYKFN